MTPQPFYNTGIEQLLDEKLNHLKNMKEDTDLNLRDALSAKQGKQVWPLNQTDSEGKRKINVCLPTYKEGRERKKENFSQIDKNIPSHSEDNEVTQCSTAVPMTMPST